jgi:hypothetical protein
MLKKIILAAFAAALVVLVLPAVVSAYGACHVGYTHVGPSGVYHTGETVARGPSGVYAGGRTTAVGYGGTEYRGATEYRGVSSVSPGYHYAPSYSGGAAYRGTTYGGAVEGGYRYGYVR